MRSLANRRTVPVALGGVLAAALVLVALFTGFVLVDNDNAVSSSASGRWERLSDPPLSPRSSVVSVWTGREALFVGGDTFVCPPSASCTGEGVTIFSDGAAFDPAMQTWRSIADAPVPLPDASTAVIRGDVYFLIYERRHSSPSFYRYSMAADSWTSLPLPPAELLGQYRILGAGDRLVAYATSHEQGPSRDFIFAPSSGVWSELPESPLRPAFGRHMIWLGPHVYLFDHELAASPGSERPSLTRVARLDAQGESWERLPDSTILASGPWPTDRTRLINPLLGDADGGAVNNWGRSHPYGGIFDASTESWRDLPVPPDSGHAAGAVGADGLLLLGTSGWILDIATGTWSELARINGDDHNTRRNLLSAGSVAIAVGGERWPADSSRAALLGEAWIWHPDTGQ